MVTLGPVLVTEMSMRYDVEPLLPVTSEREQHGRRFK